MTVAAWRVLAWGALLSAVSGGVAVLIAVRAPLVTAGEGAIDTAVRPSSAPGPTAPARGTMNPAVTEGGLFRVSRSPAPVPFDPLGDARPTAVQEPTPAFGLAGVILGSTPAALIRGIPGQGLQLLAVGEELSGVRLLLLDSTAVVLLWRGDTVVVSLPKEGT